MWLSSSTWLFRSGTIENSYLLSVVENRHVIGKRKNKNNSLHGRIYIYTHTHTHKKAHIHMYMYTNTFVYVCVYTYRVISLSPSWFFKPVQEIEKIKERLVRETRAGRRGLPQEKTKNDTTCHLFGALKRK